MARLNLNRARASWVVGFVVAGGLASMAACSAEPTQASVDVADAGGADGRAPVDARAVESGRDEEADAAPLYGEVPLPGEWKAVPGLPETCSIRLATDPAVSIPPFPWKDCASGRPGCRSFVADWQQSVSERAFTPSFREPVYEDVDGVHLSYVRELDFNNALAVRVVQVLEGDAQFAAFTRAGCAMNLHASKFGYGMSILNDDGATVSRTFLAASESGSPGKLEVTETAYSPGLRFVQSVTRGRDFLALETTQGGSIVGTSFDLVSKVYSDSTPTRNLETERVIPVASGFVGLAGVSPIPIGYFPKTGGWTPIVSPAAGSDVLTFALDRKNSDALVWFEFDGASEPVLWTQPFAVVETPAAKRKVARVPFLYSIVVNGGVLAVVTPGGRGRIVRLSDGMGWDIPPEPGLDFFFPLWVNDDFIWFEVSKPNPPTPNVKLHSGAVRIARSTLGAPTIPSGF
jgi:hypothetical protein